MEWSTFLGALVGAAIGVILTLGGFGIWDELTRRRLSRSELLKPPLQPLNSILEKYIEQFMVQRFDTLFPSWRIYDASTPGMTNSTAEGKLKGIQYHTDAGKPDILCLDSKNNFIIIELKRDRASDKVITQVDRYIGWVQKNLAQPNQRVRGLIIAKSPDKHLEYALSQRRNIDFWVYDWHLQFNKKVIQRGLRQRHVLTTTNSDEVTNDTSILLDEQASDTRDQN